MVNVPQLDSSRLKLRGFESEDFERYATMWTEPAVVRFIGGAALSREAAWSRFLRQIGHWDRLGFGFFAIEDRATGAFLGEAGFQDLHRALAPSIEGTLEAGWVLATAAHGKGLASIPMTQALIFSADDGCDIGEDSGAPVSQDYGSRGNAFNGTVKGVQLAIGEAAESSDHLVSPEEAVRIAMARQ